MTPDDLEELLDEERSRRRGAVDLTLADRLDADEERGRFRGGLL